jgi:hypothetical protein
MRLHRLLCFVPLAVLAWGCAGITPVAERGGICQLGNGSEEPTDCPSGTSCKDVGYGPHPNSYCVVDVVVGKGQPCDEYGEGPLSDIGPNGTIRRCESGLRCNKDVCTRFWEVGGPCGTASDSCSSDLHCDLPSLTCAGRGSGGAWCHGWGDCATAFYCDGWKGWDGAIDSEEDGHCQAGKALGEACDVNWQCATTVCRFGTCDEGADGAVCENHFDCKSRFCPDGTCRQHQ